MIEIPVYNSTGKQTGTFELDEQLLGGEVNPILLKQAFVRTHANKRQGSAKTKSRNEVSYSTKKLYKQKGTGNARRGDRNANVLRGGAHAKAKRPRSFRQDMPIKMRRLANRNALLAKAVDAELKLVDDLPGSFDKPSTKQFTTLLSSIEVDRSCLVAVSDTRVPVAQSARNIDDVSLTHVDRLNVFDVLSHRYVVADKAAFEAYLTSITAKPGSQKRSEREIEANAKAAEKAAKEASKEAE